MRSILAALTVAATFASLPPFAQAQPSKSPSLEAIEKTIEAMKRDYEGRIAALEREVAGLRASVTGSPERSVQAAPRSRASISPTSTATPSTPAPSGRPEDVAAGGPPLSRTANPFNPSIAVIGNYLAVGGRNRTENLPSSSLRESEVSLQAIVDPYARADFFLAFGEEGVEVEEAALTFTTLPWDLLARVGRMRAGFGKTNPLHLHVLPWPDKPLPIVNLLGGEEGWVGTGVSVARLVPMPAGIFSEATVQVFRGDAEGLFEAPSRGDLAWNGRYRVFRDLGEATNLDVGFSYARGPNAATERARTSLEGIDTTLRWKPLRTAAYRSATLRGEWMRSRREQPGGDEDARGWFLSGEYQLAKRWFVGARSERSERADDASREDRGLAALLTFWPSEFSQVRTEMRRRSYAGGVTADEILLQIQFAIGAHGAHPF